MADDFYVRFWGVRGSIACPGPDTIRYGGNTACLEVRCGHHLLILDAGTGLRNLGNTLRDASPFAADILLSHVHYDHIMGFPFFRPAYHPDNAFRIWAAHCEQGIQGILERFLEAPLFPISLEVMQARLDFRDFRAGDTLYPAEGITVRTAPLNHPNGATGYRIEYQGKSICYVTDTEHPPGGPDEHILRLIQGAEIVIYDTTYTEAEYTTRQGWGHSTWQAGIRLCKRAGACTFAAFHHNPDHDDDFLDRMADELNQAYRGAVVAREGMTLWP